MPTLTDVKCFWNYAEICKILDLYFNYLTITMKGTLKVAFYKNNNKYLYWYMYIFPSDIYDYLHDNFIQKSMYLHYVLKWSFKELVNIV